MYRVLSLLLLAFGVTSGCTINNYYGDDETTDEPSGSSLETYDDFIVAWFDAWYAGNVECGINLESIDNWTEDRQDHLDCSICEDYDPESANECVEEVESAPCDNGTLPDDDFDNDYWPSCLDVCRNMNSEGALDNDCL